MVFSVVGIGGLAKTILKSPQKFGILWNADWILWFSPICISLCGSSSYCFLFSLLLFFFGKILEILCVVVAFCFLLLFCFLLFGFFLFWLFCFLGVWFIFSILIFSFLDIWIWKSFQSKLLLLLSKLLLFLYDKYTWWRKIWMFD